MLLRFPPPAIICCLCCTDGLWRAATAVLCSVCCRCCRGKGLELIHNAQLKAKEEEEEGPTIVKYVDMSTTSDIYDKVREYQETGKKRYP